MSNLNLMIGGAQYYPVMNTLQINNSLGTRGVAQFQVWDPGSTMSFSIGENIDIGTYPPTLISYYPPAQNSTYVKATSELGGIYNAYDATDSTKSLIDTDVETTWIASYTQYNQRFQIDLGGATVINQVYYENYHANGTTSHIGAKTFTMWGSNTPTAFADTTWISDADMIIEGWTQLTTSQSTFDQHIVANIPDPKYITVTNTTAYQYYCFKFVDTYLPAVNYMGLRRLVLQHSPTTTDRIWDRCNQ
jgi:hypothetical protein